MGEYLQQMMQQNPNGQSESGSTSMPGGGGDMMARTPRPMSEPGTGMGPTGVQPPQMQGNPLLMLLDRSGILDHIMQRMTQQREPQPGQGVNSGWSTAGKAGADGKDGSSAGAAGMGMGGYGMGQGFNGANQPPQDPPYPILRGPMQ